jgi:hypothetical protein
MNRPVAAILLRGADVGPSRRVAVPEAMDSGRRWSSSSAPVNDALLALIQRLATANITVVVVEDLQEARAVAGLRDDPPRGDGSAMDDSGAVAMSSAPRVTPILVDLRELCSEDPEDLETAHRLLSDCRAAFSGQGPIAVTSGAPPRMLLECFRAGAADVIDLVHEGTASARVAVLRTAGNEQQRRAERRLVIELRSLLDELVRDLVRTERRTIDLERELDGDAQRTDEQTYLERIKARHEQILARYLEVKSGS